METNIENYLRSCLKSFNDSEIEKMIEFARGLSEFLDKEHNLLSEQISDIENSCLYYLHLSQDFKRNPTDANKRLLKAAKMMLKSKICEFRKQEQMIIFVLNQEETKTTREIENILMKHKLL